tara:strand:- start:104 stop:706 length:603 start_codon:yes stop_codon:yes gene_type:complete
MKRLLLILILIFSFQSLTKADDIRDFQIEGISIGDSLLDYFKINTIKSARKYEYSNDKFYSIDIWSDKFNQYAAIQFHLKKEDKKYIVHGLSGSLTFGNLGVYRPNSKKECKNKKKLIMDSISSIFPSADMQSQNILDANDGYGGKAVRLDTYYTLDVGQIWIQCVIWGKKTKKKEKLFDNLRLTLLTPDFVEWIGLYGN